MALPEIRLRSVTLLWGVAAAVVVILLVVRVAAEALLLTFAGVLFAAALRGAATWVARRLRIGVGGALALVLAISALASAAVVVWIVPRVDDQVAMLLERLTRSYTELRAQLEASELGRWVLGSVGEVERLASVSRAAGVVMSALGMLGAALFVTAVTIYLASAPRLYTQAVVRLVPPAHRPRAREVLGELARALRRWMYGRIVSMTAVGVTTSLGLWLMGIPLAGTLGVLSGLLGFVPNLGPIASAVPALLIAATVDFNHVLYVGALYLVINIADGYILTPAIEKRAVHLPPAFVIAMQLVFGALFGVLGLTLATPLLACVVVLVHRLYVEDVLEGAPARKLGVLQHPAPE